MLRITVVIPSYNHEKYIAQAIQSVLEQTYQDFEIVITDDGSRDGTVDVIKTFRDPRIRLFCFDRNQGACAAMNNNIREAKGEFIAVLNSDDLFLPDKLEKQVAFLDKNQEIGAVFGHPKLIDEVGNDFVDASHLYQIVFKQSNRTRFEWLHHFFYQSNALCHPTVLIRKQCYKKVGYFDERFAQLPDYDFWIRLCMEYEIHIMQEDLIKFRIHSSEVNASGNRPEANIRALTEFKYLLENYLRIKTEETFYRIFPEGRRYEHCFDKDLIPFFISMLALDREYAPHQNFAINTLFYLLNDRELSIKLFDRCGFLMRDFIELTGKYDLFNADASRTICEKNHEIAILQETVEAQQQELERIKVSAGWKAIKKYQKIKSIILPE